MAPDPGGQLRLAGGDSRLWVKFERRSRRNPYKSELEGRPIYEPVDYVKIQQPGERDQWVGPATETHRMRFPAQWAAYQEQSEQTPEGTPVQLLFPNEPHIVELLLDLKVQTMEQLSSLTEQGIDRLGMDGRKYVAKAQAALDRSEALREVTRLEHVVGQQTDEIAVLKGAIDRQRIEMEALRKMVEENSATSRAREMFGMQNQAVAQAAQNQLGQVGQVGLNAPNASFPPPPARVQLVD